MAAHASHGGPGEFSPQERLWLLRLAHSAIEAGLRLGAKAGAAAAVAEAEAGPPSMPLPSHLKEPRGAFTTLHLGGRLRGCVGFILPALPLYQTVAETAQAAAFDDTRFYPVSAAETPLLQIEISVLSPLSPIRPEEVEVGRHGLLVSHHGRRGLLLPQVPAEHGWDRETFLDQTCLKAGLPLTAWRSGAILEAFTAEIFGE